VRSPQTEAAGERLSKMSRGSPSERCPALAHIAGVTALGCAQQAFRHYSSRERSKGHTLGAVSAKGSGQKEGQDSGEGAAQRKTRVVQ
jgi:hypothetical protein